MFWRLTNYACILATVLFAGSAVAQPIPLIPQGGTNSTAPLGIAMYYVFTNIVLRDAEAAGTGVKYVRNVVGIEEPARAEATFEYIRAAFYAGRHSSEVRMRELCQRPIETREDFVRELENRRDAHEAELSRLALGIEKLIVPDEYSKLLRTVEAVRAGLVRDKIDYAALYAPGTFDVAAEVERLCAV